MKKVFLALLSMILAICAAFVYNKNNVAEDKDIQSGEQAQNKVTETSYRVQNRYIRNRSLEDIEKEKYNRAQENEVVQSQGNIDYYPSYEYNTDSYKTQNMQNAPKDNASVSYYLPPSSINNNTSTQNENYNVQNNDSNNQSTSLNAQASPVFSVDDYLKENLKNRGGSIAINPTSPYSFKTRDEIFEIRKRHVQNSLFAYPGYDPSVTEGLRQIEDGKPWIEDVYCFVDSNYMPMPTGGKAEESRFVNNPSVLVGLDGGYSFTKDINSAKCAGMGLKPSSAYYNADTNELEVVFNNITTGPHMHFKGLNARDLGYKYGYVDPTRSSNLPQFEQSFNISNSVTEFMDFIHTGGSCGHAGGCNNGSPYQPKLNFTMDGEKSSSVIYIKLWRKEPSSPYDEPDISEKMIIN